MRRSYGPAVFVVRRLAARWLYDGGVYRPNYRYDLVERGRSTAGFSAGGSGGCAGQRACALRLNRHAGGCTDRVDSDALAHHAALSPAAEANPASPGLATDRRRDRSDHRPDHRRPVGVSTLVPAVALSRGAAPSGRDRVRLAGDVHDDRPPAPSRRVTDGA